MTLPFPIPSLPWKWIGVGLAALAIVAAVIFSIRAYGDAKYDAGQTDERALHEKADREMLERARQAGEEATEAEIERQEKHDEIVADERKRIDEALERGESPFDSMDGFSNAAGGGLL